MEWGTGAAGPQTPLALAPSHLGLSTELIQGALVTAPSLRQRAPTLPRGIEGHQMGLMPQEGLGVGKREANP